MAHILLSLSVACVCAWKAPAAAEVSWPRTDDEAPCFLIEETGRRRESEQLRRETREKEKERRGLIWRQAQAQQLGQQSRKSGVEAGADTATQ